MKKILSDKVETFQQLIEAFKARKTKRLSIPDWNIFQRLARVARNRNEGRTENGTVKGSGGTLHQIVIEDGVEVYYLEYEGRTTTRTHSQSLASAIPR